MVVAVTLLIRKGMRGIKGMPMECIRRSRAAAERLTNRLSHHYYRVCVCAAVGCALLPLPALADEPTLAYGAPPAPLLLEVPLPGTQESTPLSEAWLTTLATEQRLDWAYSLVLKRTTAHELEQRQHRLVAELGTLEASARLSDRAALANGLRDWRQQLQRYDATRARTPGRHDLPWLAADLRRDLPLEALHYWGQCQPPRWVELWGLGGVARVTWQPGLTLQALLSAAPEAAGDGNQAVLISPHGDQQVRGIAAWNRETTQLAPGSRVMVLLPGPQGLRKASPFPGTLEESRWINQHLPRFLATRLPGDVCTLWTPAR